MWQELVWVCSLCNFFLSLSFIYSSKLIKEHECFHILRRESCSNYINSKWWTWCTLVSSVFAEHAWSLGSTLSTAYKTGMVLQSAMLALERRRRESKVQDLPSLQSQVRASLCYRRHDCTNKNTTTKSSLSVSNIPHTRQPSARTWTPEIAFNNSSQNNTQDWLEIQNTNWNLWLLLAF